MPHENPPSSGPSGAHRLRSASLLAVCAVTLCATLPSAAQQPPALEAAGTLAPEAKAPPEPASTEPDAGEVERLEAAILDEPESLDLRADLLRATYLLGHLGGHEKEQRQAIFTRGTELATQAMRLLHERESLEWKQREEIVGEARQHERGGELHYWAAMVWGAWGDEAGVFPALREGVADRLRIHGHVALEVAPDVDFAGPYRFLGRMHAVAPKVPMFTGWVDRGTGVELLQEAHGRAPEHPHNQLFLAESWLDQVPAKRGEALAMLESLVAFEPRPGHETHDLKALEEIRLSASAHLETQAEAGAELSRKEKKRRKKKRKNRSSGP